MRVANAGEYCTCNSYSVLCNIFVWWHIFQIKWLNWLLGWVISHIFAFLLSCPFNCLLSFAIFLSCVRYPTLCTPTHANTIYFNFHQYWFASEILSEVSTSNQLRLKVFMTWCLKAIVKKIIYLHGAFSLREIW